MLYNSSELLLVWVFVALFVCVAGAVAIAWVFGLFKDPQTLSGRRVIAVSAAITVWSGIVVFGVATLLAVL